ncbi:hypothetical protein QFY99_00860 [Sphingobacterium faecium]|nr:hypothetical protein [Sphingobacterium faecium]
MKWGARMGLVSKISMLNKWNQIPSVPNAFVTDDVVMTSTSEQNPSLTYRAFLARAIDYAMLEMKKGNM